MTDLTADITKGDVKSAVSSSICLTSDITPGDVKGDVTKVVSEGNVRSSPNGFFQSKKNNLFDITRSDVKKKKNIPLYIRSGVYYSNIVYKSHLEFYI